MATAPGDGVSYGTTKIGTDSGSVGREPDGPVQDTYLDTTRIRHDTGYQPEYGLTGGLADITPPASGR